MARVVRRAVGLGRRVGIPSGGRVYIRDKNGKFASSGFRVPRGGNIPGSGGKGMVTTKGGRRVHVNKLGSGRTSRANMPRFYGDSPSTGQPPRKRTGRKRTAVRAPSGKFVSRKTVASQKRKATTVKRRKAAAAAKRQSTRKSPSAAKAVYTRSRNRGESHATALKKSGLKKAPTKKVVAKKPRKRAKFPATHSGWRAADRYEARREGMSVSEWRLRNYGTSSADEAHGKPRRKKGRKSMLSSQRIKAAPKKRRSTRKAPKRKATRAVTTRKATGLQGRVASRRKKGMYKSRRTVTTRKATPRKRVAMGVSKGKGGRIYRRPKYRGKLVPGKGVVY